MLSTSAIVVNERGQCSGKNIMSGSKKHGFGAQLCHKYILELRASFLNSHLIFLFDIVPVFHFSSGRCVEHELTNYGPQVKYVWLSAVFDNKVLLRHGYTHILHVIYGCFCATMAEMRGCNRDCRVQKYLKYLLFSPLQIKLVDP